MHPIIFENSFISLKSLWVITTLGLIVSINYFLINLKRKRLSAKFLIKHQIAFVLIIVIFSRVGGIIENWSYLENTSFFQLILLFVNIFDQQYSLTFGLIGFIIFLLYILKQEEEEILKWTDILSMSILILLIFHAAASFFDGQLHGKETNLPWGVILENMNVSYTVPIHPTQIYYFFYTLDIFLAVNYFQKRFEFFKISGNTTFFCLFIFFALKAIEFFFRGDEALTLFGFRFNQFISILVAIVGILILLNKNPNLKQKIIHFLKKFVPPLHKI